MKRYRIENIESGAAVHESEAADAWGAWCRWIESTGEIPDDFDLFDLTAHARLCGYEIVELADIAAEGCEPGERDRIAALASGRAGWSWSWTQPEGPGRLTVPRQDADAARDALDAIAADAEAGP